MTKVKDSKYLSYILASSIVGASNPVVFSDEVNLAEDVEIAFRRFNRLAGGNVGG
jgi:hypothetical protein